MRFIPFTIGAVFKSAGSIVLNSFLVRVILQRGFYCSEDSIALIKSYGGESYDAI